MAIQTAIAFTDEEITLMAKVAFRQSQLGGRGEDIPFHELHDAIFYVQQALLDLKNRHTYDPQAYARMTAKAAIIQYTKAYLNGADPYASNEFLLSMQSWLKAAAKERYSNRPNSWPEYPTIPQRLRDQTYRNFDPDAQTSEDF